MTLFYSAATPGFFDDAIHAVLPADAVKITPARHRELLAAQGEGAAIEASDSGKPRIRRLVLSAADQRPALVRRAKREAARRIDAVAPLWRQLNDSRLATPEGAARFAAVDAIRVASQLIEAQIEALAAADLPAFDIPHHPAWPESDIA